MNRATIDIETLKDFFCLTALDYNSNKYIQFEISNRKNQFEEIKEFLNSIKYFIGFNSISFDETVLLYIIKNNITNTKDIYLVAQDIIENGDNFELNQKYRILKYNKPWKSIDLFLYWSKMLRLSKKLSLKYFAVNLDMNVQEMPIYHTKENLIDEEIELVLQYNLNDCEVTKALGNKLSSDINLRVFAKKLYGFDCLSWDGVKLGYNILLKTYSDKNNFDIKYIKTLRTKRDVIEIKDILLKEIKFKEREDLSFQWIKIKDKNVKLFKSFYALHQDLLKQKVTSTEEINYRIIYKDIVYDIKSGGLHSYHNKAETIKPNDNQLYIDMDCSSYYPTLGSKWGFIPEHLKEGKFEEDLANIRNERVAIKSTNPEKALLLKLAMNGGFYGNTNNEHTAMQDLACMLSITLNGQLFLLMYCEICEEENIHVDMANTDGITYLFDKELLDKFYKISKDWEAISKMELEEVRYKSVWRTSINDYLALSEKGKIKAKGEFIYEKVLDGSNEFLITTIALKEYFINNISIKDIILNHKNIFDFCAAKKVDKKYSVIYNTKKIQQLNRFYCSKQGAYLYKQKKGKNTLEHVFKESGIQILNDPNIEFPNDINYQFYINKTQAKLDLFNSKQLKLF